MNAVETQNTKLPALVVGGNVSAVVPQSVEEMWRVSKMVVLGGLAPKALVGRKVGEEATSAVAIAVMAGAELGLPPMVSLRSFTVIGGRPALYGDGLINVVRRSRKAAFVKTGYDVARQVGWCEAKRSDTGEAKREEFSVDDAKRAGLWDDRPTVKKQDWETKTWKDVPNDAPWFRYPQRMMAWRAAGYCLRELFADVLGGITDEYEAREIAGDDAIDVTPSSAPIPPAAPVENGSEAEAPTDFDYGDFFERLDAAFRDAKTSDEVEAVWDYFDVAAKLTHDPHGLELADNLRIKRQAALSPLGAG